MIPTEPIGSLPRAPALLETVDQHDLADVPGRTLVAEILGAR
jgi:hypothetical protein